MTNTPVQNGCLFCEMAAGPAQPHTIHEDAYLMAFLDFSPIRRGHVQIIPRAHHAYFDDLPSGLATRIFTVGQTIAKAQKRLYNVERVAFLFTGGDIPHAHVHLVPMIEKTDITSRQYIAEPDLTFQPIPRASEPELAEVAAELKRELSQTLLGN